MASAPRSLSSKLAPRLRADRVSAASTPTPAHGATAPTSVLLPLVARFSAKVIAGGSFSTDWSRANIVSSEPILQQLEGRASRILEIDSYEGQSACYFLWRLPDALVACIDTFEGSLEHVVVGESLRRASRFRATLGCRPALTGRLQREAQTQERPALRTHRRPGDRGP